MSTAYTDDPANRVATLTYPSGLVVTYGRDTMGRVTSIGAANPNIGLSGSVVSACP